VGFVLSLFLAGDGRAEGHQPAPDSDADADCRPTLAGHRFADAIGLERVVEQPIETVVDGLVEVVEMSLDHGPLGGRTEGFRDPGPIHGLVAPFSFGLFSSFACYIGV
jgi:hypothetical protein